MSTCLTVLADDTAKLDSFREALAGIPHIHIAERLASGGAELAWVLAARPVVQILRLDLRPGPLPVNGDSRCLTARELGVLRLMAHGHSYEEISGRLGVSPHTVASHVKNTYRKLAVHSAPAAVMRAVEMQLIVAPTSAPAAGAR
jgi:DNA-binding NarL/FixJ family response regulator